MKPVLWIRDEDKPFEHRAVLAPPEVKKMVDHGIKVVVEESKNRIYSAEKYKEVGAETSPSRSWVKAPKDAIILGLKELKKEDLPLAHTHFHFAHCYKGQKGSENTLNRFKKGGGTLYDLEFLVDSNERRVASFGHWAGFIGAALGIDIFHFKNVVKKDHYKLPAPFASKNDCFQFLKKKVSELKNLPSVIIIGARGRCGKGASALNQGLNIETTLWDIDETRQGGPFKEITRHNIFVNCVLIGRPTEAFIDHSILDSSNQLSVISDVSCDPKNPLNPVALYQRETTLDDPLISIDGTHGSISILAIDHLPTLLPKESSDEYSKDLAPYIMDFMLNKDQYPFTWKYVKDLFDHQVGLITGQ